MLPSISSQRILSDDMMYSMPIITGTIAIVQDALTKTSQMPYCCQWIFNGYFLPSIFDKRSFQQMKSYSKTFNSQYISWITCQVIIHNKYIQDECNRLHKPLQNSVIDTRINYNEKWLWFGVQWRHNNDLSWYDVTKTNPCNSFHKLLRCERVHHARFELSIKSQGHFKLKYLHF